MRADKKFAKKLNSRFSQKQNELRRQPGVLGDGNGNVAVSGLSNYSYVTVSDKAMPVFNNRVPPQNGVKVWVGYASEEPTLFQVLSTRSDAPSGINTGFTGYAPARRYEWGATDGGQDPLHVHLRAISFLKVGMSTAGGMFVTLLRGRIWTGTTYLNIATQDIDLTSFIPVTSGKAAFVLVTISNAGTVVTTDGADVNIELLAFSDIPAVPSGTAFVCAAVRVYQGQTQVLEARTNTDFVDLRFTDRPNATVLSPVDYIQFNTAATPVTNAEGLLQWNATDGTLDLGMSGGDIAMQIGQELFTKVRNVSGSTITNGSVVYVSGNTGIYPEISLARADAESTSRVLGVATQDIASPAFGFVTTVGYVRGIKTNYSGAGIWGTTWVTGDLLYVSKTTAGQLTNVEPTTPHHSDTVGTVAVVHPTQGSILITLDRHKTLAELTDVNGTPLATTGQFPVWDQSLGVFDFNYNIANYPDGSGTAGRVASWTDSNTLQAAALIAPASNVLTLTNAADSTFALNITAAKTLTLTAADNYSILFPASGTVALLSPAQTFLAAQTIQPATDVVNLTLKHSAAANTANLLDLQTGAGVSMGNISANAKLTLGNGNADIGGLNSTLYSATLSQYAVLADMHITANVRSSAGLIAYVYTPANLDMTQTLANSPTAILCQPQVFAGTGKTIAETHGLRVLLAKYSAGALTTFKAFTLETPVIVAGTVVNNYGLFINNQTGATNNWAIKTGTGLNSLGDALEIIGSADRTQQIVRAHSTQSAASRMLSVQNSSSVEQVYISGDYVTGTKGRRQATAVKTANYTLTANDEVIVGTGANSWTLDLSTVAALGIGTWTIINDGTGTITIDAGASGLLKQSRYQYLTAGSDIIIRCYAVNAFA